MKIISFAETTPALLAGAKCATRRDWAERHARSFHAGELVQAWDKTPRVKGAHRVGTVRLTVTPYREASNEIPDADWEAEGFAYMEAHALTLFGGATPREVWTDWKTRPRLLWVVRFDLVAVIKDGEWVRP
ncbi:MAG: hypothetical protein WC211_12645 [Dehalococcoidia bacterium]